MRVICTDPRTDEERFTRGACFILAEVINDQTGWPICAFWNESEEEIDYHVFVQKPDGNYLDIRGSQTRQELLEWWGPGKVIVHDIDPLELFDWTCPFDHQESYERAIQIAPDLIRMEVNPNGIRP